MKTTKTEVVTVHLHSWEWLGLASILAQITKNRRALRQREVVSPILQKINELIHCPPTDKVVGLSLPKKSFEDAIILMQKKMPRKEPHDLHGDHAILSDVEKQFIVLTL